MRRDRGIVCLVTDRAQLGAPADDLAAIARALRELAREAVDAGVDIIQVRERYLVAATVFATPSKPAGSPLLLGRGLTGIVEAVRVPVLAIGGVTMERIAEVAAAGAAGVAGIRLFLAGGTSMATVVRSVRERFD